ncbi:phosphatase PAP2 family protein [Streptomyces sp. NPDC057806]|uniref:phosphatase PAP2 family protein n=1 Tax=Streptomyces sp. NPDC057806 TaxID=3346255 RepID=UPI0036746476
MGTMADLRDGDHLLARRVIGCGPSWMGRAAPVVQEAAEHTKLWWATAGALAAFGGWRGRTAAAAGITAMAAAEVLCNAGAKQLYRRRRPPREWIPPEELQDRPDSSSFPSGHTAAAVAFAGAVTPPWPAAGVACAVMAGLVAAERVYSGAHYPSDVVFGGLLGLGAAALVRNAPKLLWRSVR